MSNILYACLTSDPEKRKIPTKSDDPKILKAAFQKNAIWPPNSVIKIGFGKGKILLPNGDNTFVDANFSQEKADWVQKTIEKYIIPFLGTIKFVWNTPLVDSDVRISFVKEAGAFSVIGTEAKEIKEKNMMTMNLGWIDKDDSGKKSLRGTGVVVVHEFGHMLGLVHEHQRGDSPLKWNKELVYKVLGGPPNKWNKEQVDDQIFKKLDMNTLNASKFDPNSVMEYIFPSEYFLVDPKLKDNAYLSNLDIVWISKIYNNGKLPDGINEDGTGTNPFGGGTGTGVSLMKGAEENVNAEKSWLQNNWYWIAIVGVLIILILILRKKPNQQKKIGLSFNF